MVVEYVVMLVLIIMVMFGIIVFFGLLIGGSFNNMFDKIGEIFFDVGLF